jgi:hypothetical protein
MSELAMAELVMVEAGILWHDRTPARKATRTSTMDTGSATPARVQKKLISTTASSGLTQEFTSKNHSFLVVIPMATIGAETPGSVILILDRQPLQAAQPSDVTS